MQPVANATRPTMTYARTKALFESAPDLRISKGGLELVNLDLTVVEDISDDLAGGEVRRNSLAVRHGSAGFRISRDLDWGAALLRPYVEITGTAPGFGATTARYNLGVYHPSIPEDDTLETPATFDVDGDDILLRLDQPIGDAYAIAAGDSYLDRVEQIILGRGYVSYVIDPASAATVAPTDRTWAFDDQTTWLTVVNDLLASIGYRGIWSDWDGTLRCGPYVLPQTRSAEWSFTDDSATTMLGASMKRVQDYAEAPNRWVFYRSNNVDDVPPAEGVGMYTFQNDNIGLTSVQARGGLVITKVQGLDAADYPSLVAQGNAIAQTDMDVPIVYTVTVVPFPLTWHFDRWYVNTAALLADVQCTEWSLTLPPDSGDMVQTWRPVSQ